MPKRMQRFISLLLICCSLLLTLSFVGCGKTPPPADRSYDEAVVTAAARELLPKSVLVNELFYGKGIPISEQDGAREQGRYREADAAYLSEKGITDIESMKTLAYGVYCDSFCESMFSTTLKSYYDDDVIVGYLRYFEIQATDTEPYALMVDTEASVLLRDTVLYDPSTVRTDGAKGELVYIKVDITVTNAEGKSQSRTIRVAMIEETEGWRFYELTGASYSEYFNRIEE